MEHASNDKLNLALHANKGRRGIKFYASTEDVPGRVNGVTTKTFQRLHE